MRWDRLLPSWAPAGKAQQPGTPPVVREMTAASNRHKFLAGGGQNLAPAFCYYNHVFNSHAPLAGNVNSGFDGDYHPRLQDLGLPGADAWRLVDFQAYAVSGRMREILR